MNLEQLMKQKGLTKADLEKNHGISKATLGRAIKGETKPNSNTVTLFAKALDVSVEEMREILKSPPNSDHVGKLVHQALMKLQKSGLIFEPPEDEPDKSIYLCIAEDIVNGPNYFDQEFRRLLNEADDKQLKLLKELVVYCAAFFIDRNQSFNLEDFKKLDLKGLGRVWELRIFVNSQTKALKGLDITIKEGAVTGAPKLIEPIGVHPIGSADSADVKEMFYNLLGQINEKEPLVDEILPDFAYIDSEKGRAQFKHYCSELNAIIAVRHLAVDSILAYANKPIPKELVNQVDQYLPALRVIQCQVDDGETFLINQSIQLEKFLIVYLDRITNKEKHNSITNKIQSEEPTMASSQDIKIYGDVKNANFGNHNQINISNDLNELISIIKQLREALALNEKEDSEVIQALDKASQTTAESKNLTTILKDALDKSGQVIKTGTKLMDIYSRGKDLFDGIFEGLKGVS